MSDPGEFSEKIKEHLTEHGIWVRALYMALFAVIYSVAKVILVAVVVFQLATKLLTGKVNGQLLGLGKNLSVYIYNILLFLTFNSEEKPYPFGDWPGESAQTTASKKPSRKKKSKKALKESTETPKPESDSGAT